MKSGQVFLGLLAGLAAGAVLGILFAPEKGAKTRKQIMNKGEDYADALKDKFDDLVDTIARKYDSMGREAEVVMSKGKEKLDGVKKEVHNSSM